VPWPTIAATAALGAAVVAISGGLFSSPVAVAVALVFAAALSVVSLVLSRRVQKRRAPIGLPKPWLQAFESSAAQADAEPPAPPVRTPSPSVVSANQTPLPLWSPPSLVPEEPAEAARSDIAAPVAAVAHSLADEAVRRLRAPAASVLIPRGRRLVAAGTAGDWSLAGAGDDAEAPTTTDAEPDGSAPEFPMDDFLPRFLGLYPRAVPVERWQDLADAPLGLLPLAALADRGAGVAIPLRHRRQLAGLWVLARRSKNQPYSDAELSLMERIARRASPLLADALTQSTQP
jgi:hypothetical protein